MLDARGGVSRQTALALLLGLAPALTGVAAPVDPATRERVLGWARRQPPGPLSLGDAPLERSCLSDLPGQLARLDALLFDWTRDGAWVLGRDDAAYPKRLRRRLGREAPPLLFGRGEPGLPGRGGVAVVRGAAAEPAEVSMLDAALAESTLGVIALPPDADEILVTRVAAPAADAALRVSPPGADRADRVALDACRYGLADTVVAVGLGRGDPDWGGLVALVAGDRQPVWVLGAGGDAGLLVRAGAHAIPPGLLVGGADGLLLPGRNMPRPSAGPGRRAEAPPMPHPVLVRGFAEAQAGFGADAPPPPPAKTGAPMLRLVETARRPVVPPAEGSENGSTLFEVFSRRLLGLLSHGPLGAGRIAEAMDLTRPQVDAWLLRAEADGTVRSDPRTRLFGLR